MQKKIKVGDFELGDEEKKAINDVLDKGRLSEGEKTREFERKWADFIGTKHAVALSSGTTTLIAGLTALKYLHNIKDNNKVITSPLSYIATANSITTTNLKPVFVDVDRDNLCITPENIKAHLEEADDINNYSIILPVHLMGYVCDMDNINKIAKEYSLITFEDSSQAHGSVYNGKKAGSLSTLSAFSFYIAHNIQAGEMGAITSDDYELIKLIKKIKAHGRMCDCGVCKRDQGECPRISNHEGNDDFDPRFCHDIIGYNFKTMEFQAALALTQLKKANWITKKRQENVKYLNEGLNGFSDILQLPIYSNNISYIAYPIVIKKPEIISRKKLRLELEKNNVETRPLFGCIPTQQEAYLPLKEKYSGKLPNAEYLGKNAFYIGCHQYLNTNDLDYIINVFKKIFNRH